MPREHLLTGLVRDVLGPRGGPQEVLPPTQDPRDEFITGVLAPLIDDPAEREIEAEVEEVVQEVFGEEDEPEDGQLVVPSFSPSLDPKSQPHSMGISFVLTTTGETPEIEVCATWARYQSTPEGWRRTPAHFLTGIVRIGERSTWDAGGNISLSQRARFENGRWKISIFLVNNSRIAPNTRPTTQDFVFQPQIRISCRPGTIRTQLSTTIVPGENAIQGSMAAEEAELSLLYRNNVTYARGHLCSAVWREIDPERPHPTIPLPPVPPFRWVDSDSVPEGERAKFSPAELRTEFVPCCPVEIPQMEWKTEYGSRPEFDPEILAETWKREELETALRPLAEGYGRWLVEKRTELQGLGNGQREIAQRHIEQCESFLSRLGHSLDLLLSDEDARLAFCFSNKVMAVQSRWARNRVFPWRPFQLAFILLNIPALLNPQGEDRSICDLLWFPTGGGKTEAYLGLAAFIIALRRRKSPRRSSGDKSGAGMAVLSRYTLRLLTIQQFRRALGVITACEFLRVSGMDSRTGPVGWRPRNCPNQESFLWGGIRFSVGLWVGGGVTPNNLRTIMSRPEGGQITHHVGAIHILQGAKRDYRGHNERLRRALRGGRIEAEGEPAQVLNCPCCKAVLAVPESGLEGGGHNRISFVYRRDGTQRVPDLGQINFHYHEAGITVQSTAFHNHPSPEYGTVSISFTIREGLTLLPEQIETWWANIIGPALGNAQLQAASPQRPGYFILGFQNSQGNRIDCDFDIYCPNPDCELNRHAWAELVPQAIDSEAISSKRGRSYTPVPASSETAELPIVMENQWQQAQACFRKQNSDRLSYRIPIPAFTVDEQIYHRLPSMVIATVDKFARLPFEPRSASLFGNVDHYHSRLGYYREGCPPSFGPPSASYQGHPSGAARGNQLHVPVNAFDPPDLIIQDELHLIEGPLGSMVGMYEAAVDLLCQNHNGNQPIGPKYVASSATVRQAERQVRALFNRSLAQFPPAAILANDRFFSRVGEVHPIESERPGRLYVGVCAPGKGAQTPIVRIWASLLQNVHELWNRTHDTRLDSFWTLVGYFNAIRELAGAVSLIRQDIPQRLSFTAGAGARLVENYLELSSRSSSSTELPVKLEKLEKSMPDSPDVLDAVFSTSMFGTGVDVNRLGLMVVHGQPKNTASYIQATGRVGRQQGGLVVTFLRASRPRDLNHYEFFTGYHGALYRYVEPITVAPFSPRVRERALGPIAVALLRNCGRILGNLVHPEWKVQQRLSGSTFLSHAVRMASNRVMREVMALPGLLERRAASQPHGRRPRQDVTSREMSSGLDQWQVVARNHQGDTDRFVYNEPAQTRDPIRAVVLGDAQHRARGLQEVYPNAPNSLRDVEETTGFKS